MTIPRNTMQETKTSPRRFAGVSLALWAVLAVSVSLLAVVHTYVSRSESSWSAPAGPASGLPSIEVRSPDSGVAAAALRLGWKEVPQAVGYRLRITSITGTVIAEGLPVEETWWSPPEELLPALVKGEYVWDVTAVDGANAPLARSTTESIRILY